MSPNRSFALALLVLAGCDDAGKAGQPAPQVLCDLVVGAFPLVARYEADVDLAAVAVAAAADPNRRRVLLSGSAVGYYGDTGSRAEDARLGRRVVVKVLHPELAATVSAATAAAV